ncbi:hypothetical protein PMIN01_08414 [Paraphaeosphaeria minitans]|uniref:Uncharacterized protein n=1 Tax=Paraphaeosphaeria minitans TaxID=565426 RepID=A0A9P6GF43_9PLEO|nr:hypothetical protein PMIN01_08414 [Paraphaeosphaeria minitans]
MEEPGNDRAGLAGWRVVGWACERANCSPILPLCTPSLAGDEHLSGWAANRRLLQSKAKHEGGSGGLRASSSTVASRPGQSWRAVESWQAVQSTVASRSVGRQWPAVQSARTVAVSVASR